MSTSSKRKKQFDLFSQTYRPKKSLFYKSHDKLDKKFGDVVSNEIKEYANSELVIVGCPQDIGVKRNKGRIGASKAPDKIRELFYRMSAPTNFNKNNIFDIGNTIIKGTLEQIHNSHEELISRLLKDGKKIIVLGGGNDISYPDCKALSQNTKSILAFNIDSHFDVRENKQRNSGTPYRQLLEENHLKPNSFYEIAIQNFANSDIYRDYLKKKKVNVITLEQLRTKDISKSIGSILNRNRSASIFWGFDMDSVRAADAPGVSASYPTGLTAEEILKIASIAGKDKRSRIFEISEVNPRYDIDNRTSKLAALLIREFLTN